MRRKNSYGSRSYGKVTDYAETIRKRSLRKEIFLWTIEIIGVAAVAFLIAYYLM